MTQRRPVSPAHPAQRRHRAAGAHTLPHGTPGRQGIIHKETDARATILIEPQFPEGGVTGPRQFTSGRRYIDLGKHAAEAALPAIRAALPWLQPPGEPAPAREAL